MSRILPRLSAAERLVVMGAFEEALRAGLERPACYRAAVEGLQKASPGGRKDLVAFRAVAALMEHVRLEKLCRDTVAADRREAAR
jgi:hypothetical protein